MKTIFHISIALLFAFVALASCSKDDEKSPANTITIDGVEKNIGYVRYNIYNFSSGEKGGFRISTASSRDTFDPEKDFDLYLELKSIYIGVSGTEADNASRVYLRSNGKSCSTEHGAIISEGSIIIKMGSNDQAEIRINMLIKYQETPGSATTYHRIQCNFKGKMQYAESFGGI